ncbi:hypothetical protein IE53DRAFT_377999 [Violaceomyces palustris]|uniref:Uncharacterized protein n=1 Tax=Violaceomyces palustris TaxID=1673888 RepID=A0ACD0P3L8_9BASI|nr:hypothetical protein IE53DRAFT_377999 [Violaceomyces palustris]
MQSRDPRVYPPNSNAPPTHGMSHQGQGQRFGSGRSMDESPYGHPCRHPQPFSSSNQFGRTNGHYESPHLVQGPASATNLVQPFANWYLSGLPPPPPPPPRNIVYPTLEPNRLAQASSNLDQRSPQNYGGGGSWNNHLTPPFTSSYAPPPSGVVGVVGINNPYRVGGGVGGTLTTPTFLQHHPLDPNGSTARASMFRDERHGSVSSSTSSSSSSSCNRRSREREGGHRHRSLTSMAKDALGGAAVGALVEHFVDKAIHSNDSKGPNEST